MKGQDTRYHCAKIHDCICHSVLRNVNILIFQHFQSAPVTVTLDQGEPKWYILKGFAIMYHSAKFHDCSGHIVRENADVCCFLTDGQTILKAHL